MESFFNFAYNYLSAHLSLLIDTRYVPKGRVCFTENVSAVLESFPNLNSDKVTIVTLKEDLWTILRFINPLLPAYPTWIEETLPAENDLEKEGKAQIKSNLTFRNDLIYRLACDKVIFTRLKSIQTSLLDHFVLQILAPNLIARNHRLLIYLGKINYQTNEFYQVETIDVSQFQLTPYKFY